MQNDPLEQDLESLELDGPKPHLQSDTLQQAFHAPAAATTSTGSRQSWPLLIAASLLLSVVGLWQLKKWQQADGGQANAHVERVSAAGEFYVYSTAPESQTILAQDFDQFDLQTIAAGSQIGSHTLKAIEETTLVLESAGQEHTVSIDTHNQNAMTQLQNEIQSLDSAFQQQVIGVNDIKRLRQIAQFENKQAIELLQRISSSPLATSEEAGKALSSNYSTRQLSISWNYAKTSSDIGTRLKAVKSLGSIKSPLSLKMLTDLAVQESELGSASIKEIVKFDPASAAAALRTIYNDGQDSTTCDLASKTLQSILEDIQHESK